MMGAVFIPVIGGFLWFAVMGGSALDLIQNHGKTAIAEAVSSDVTSALFKFFEFFPMSAFLSVLAMVLVIIFFITSADSAIFVLGMISENGNPNPASFTKIIWGVVIAAVSAVLIVTGGLQGLQSALVATSIPLAILMLFMCYSTYKGLKGELIHTSKTSNKPMSNPTSSKKQAL